MKYYKLTARELVQLIESAPFDSLSTDVDKELQVERHMLYNSKEAFEDTT